MLRGVLEIVRDAGWNPEKRADRRVDALVANHKRHGAVDHVEQFLVGLVGMGTRPRAVRSDAPH